MKPKLLSTLLLLALLSVAFCDTTELSSEEKAKLKPQVAHVESCKEEYPYLSVGDFNLTNDNFTSVTSSAKALLVIVTAADCDYCCKFEEVFQEIKDQVLSNKTLLHGADVKMARVSLENVPKIKDRIKKLPELIFFTKDDAYTFEHGYEVSSIGRIMAKIIQPIKTLKSQEEFQEFFDTPITFEKGGEEVTALKVIGLYSKRDELDDELKEFKKAAVKHSIYRDLQFALVTKQNIIENIYQEKGSFWFPPYMRSTVLLIDRRGNIHKIDPTLNHDQLGDKIHLKGKALVEQLTQQTQELFRRMKWALLITFVDPDDKKVFEPHIDILTEVAKKYEGHMAFSYLNNTKHSNKRELMGIYHDRMPAIAITLPSSPQVYVYPEDLPLNAPNLNKFIQNFFENKIAPINPQTSAPKKEAKEKHAIFKLLSNVEEVHYDNFQDRVYKEGTDVMVLLLTPSDDKNLEAFVRNYDRSSERFKALGINSVRLVVYDLSENPSPPGIDVYTTPMITFIPAYQKEPPFKVYTDMPKALTIMTYVEKYADIKFKLPDLPHLPPEMHEDYYKQKKMMDEEERKRQEAKKTIDLDL